MSSIASRVKSRRQATQASRDDESLRMFIGGRFGDSDEVYITNLRGDCIDEEGNYIGHLCQRTWRFTAKAAPADWDELTCDKDIIVEMWDE